MDKQVAIEINHVGKVYQTYQREFDRFLEAVSPTRKCYHKDFQALKDINLTVHKGECVGVIGQNGSGKSTLLKIVTGVLHPTSGEVRMKGTVSSLLELGAGFNVHYTGIENIYLNGRIMGLSDAEIKERIPLIEEFAGIGDFIHQPVKKYSSGMFARLAFAVAIHVDPDILIVDEALSVGDIFFQTKCYHKFDEFRKAGKTILFVSHDLGSVIKYCDRCILLNRGVQVAVGPCKEVVDAYRKIMVEHDREERRKTETEARREARARQAAEARYPVRKATGPSSVATDLSSAVGTPSQAGAPAAPSAPSNTAAPSQPGMASGPSTNLWKTEMLQNPDCQDYGDKQAEIIDYGLMNSRGELTGLLLKGEPYTVAVRFRFHAPIEGPIFAFTVRDLKGTEICGTNTLYLDQTLEDTADGLTGVVRFTQRMTLQGGEYLLSLGLTGYLNGELHAFHRLYDVCHMHVLSDINTVGFFDVESTVEYEDLHLEYDEIK